MDTSKPTFFSIVVPTYNRAHLIAATLDSILAQTYLHYEIIIVDDGSTDNTNEVIQKYLSENVYYYKKDNGERASARNYGTHKAKGEYINWFDSDDIMLPNNLQEAANMVERYNAPEFFAQGHQYLDPDGSILRTEVFPPDINWRLYKGNPLANSPVMVRRDIALRNPFNEDRGMSGSEDYELWLRLAGQYRTYSSAVITVSIIFHDQRSVLTMVSADQLIMRYTKFIQYTTCNSDILALLGDKKGFFEMKNYLLLAVDLAHHGHLSPGIKYLRKAIAASPRIIYERGFYAFLKHYLRNVLS